MDPEDVVELFREFGPVVVRRMFGGAGVSRDGVTFAIVSQGVIYLKVDAETTPDFEREKLAPFSYVRKDGETASMTSFRKMPDRCYDEPDEAAAWARNALAAAHRSKAPKKSAAKKSSVKQATAKKATPKATPKAAPKASAKKTAARKPPAKKKPAAKPASRAAAKKK